jgi:diguanylate cyclase (GGDEF)-like protein
MAAAHWTTRFMGRVKTYRASVGDALFLSFIVLVTAFVAFAFELFEHEGRLAERRLLIDLNETLLLGSVISVCLVIFTARRVFEQKRELRWRKKAEQEARVLAMEDPLTGLPNRRSFDEALRKAVGAPPSSGAVHAIFMLDLNGFKRINDVFGHAVGDEVLIEAARRLSGLVRGVDLVSRLGGDEFAVLAHHVTGPEGANGLALRIIEALTPPITVGNTEHTVGTGIGIALFPRDARDTQELLRKADIALYRAKAESRSCARFFEDEMDAHLKERDVLERELRAAIGTDALQPYYQPLVELKSGAIIGFEALARWTHPQMGSIPPERFIPIAEDCGLIRELTGVLLRRACRDARQWPPSVTLSFNISPVELRDRTLGLRVMAILADTGLAPNRLELEITESALVRDMDAAQEVLGSLREGGIRIALDDFGTGYSSLYHLRNFKLDKIKIDRSFIDAMMKEPESATIVRALLGLGHGLGLTVTAEGVESGDQAQALLSHGCEQGQGYLYSEAVDGAAASRLFEREGAKRAAGQ